MNKQRKLTIDEILSKRRELEDRKNTLRKEYYDMQKEFPFDDELKHHYPKIMDFYKEYGHFNFPYQSETDLNIFNKNLLLRFRQWKFTPQLSGGKDIPNMFNEESASTIRIFKELNKHGYGTDVDSWQASYEDLKAIFKKYKHSVIDTKYSSSKTVSENKLGNWVAQQRRNKHKLSNRQIYQLNQLNFIWVTDLRDIIEKSDYKSEGLDDRSHAAFIQLTRENLLRQLNSTPNEILEYKALSSISRDYLPREEINASAEEFMEKKILEKRLLLSRERQDLEERHKEDIESKMIEFRKLKDDLRNRRMKIQVQRSQLAKFRTRLSMKYREGGLLSVPKLDSFHIDIIGTLTQLTEDQILSEPRDAIKTAITRLTKHIQERRVKLMSIDDQLEQYDTKKDNTIRELMTEHQSRIRDIEDRYGEISLRG